MTPRQIAAYFFLAIVWGLSFLVLLQVVEGFGWAGAVALRCGVAAATLLGAAAVLRRRLDFRAGWKHFAVVGASTVAVQLIGLSIATPMIGTATAAIIIATIPLFSLLIAQVWGLERITSQRLVGVVLGAFGIALLVGFPAVPVTPQFVLGCGLALLSSFAAAYGSNYASRHLRSTGSWEITIGSFVAGGLMTLPLLLVVPVPGWPDASDILYLLIIGCVMSSLTYITYFRLVAEIGATRTISVEFLVTLIAVLVGAFYLDEPLSALQIGGGAFILSGCALVLGLLRWPMRAQSRA